MYRNENETICRHCKNTIYQPKTATATTILGFHSTSSKFNTFGSECVGNRSKYYNSMDLGLSGILDFRSKIQNAGPENHKIHRAYFQRFNRTTLGIDVVELTNLIQLFNNTRMSSKPSWFWFWAINREMHEEIKIELKAAFINNYSRLIHQ